MMANLRNQISYLIIGSGRVARHLHHYFQLIQEQKLNSPQSTDTSAAAWSLDAWDRAQDPLALARKVSAASHILLAISDDALESFYLKNLDGLDKTVIHFSGAKNISGTVACHPLMTFAHELYELDLYQKIHFVVSGADSLQEVLPHFPNTSSMMFSAEKAKYHALCVLGGNFTNILVAKMLQEFEAYNIPQEGSRAYIEAVIKNVFADSGHSLSGPLARKDQKTVEANLAALKNDPYQDIYEAFLKTVWPEYPKKEGKS